ncbi:MAG TPA: phospho-N-acetylmuramoyl-pentapeptide-transferase [Gammaproteobacteria bacterium]|nr:phospho-N-acetylmuramoyl-pentapeptide-transferase [Gammaproteobacteria bacterium]
MLIYAGDFLSSWFHGFKLIHYLSFRSMLALILSFVLTLIVTPKFISFMKSLHLNLDVREYTPKTHQKKIGTPSMGGLVISGVVVFVSLLLTDFSCSWLWSVLLVYVLYTLLGFVDDWYKLTKNKGISAKFKFLLQVISASVFMVFLSVVEPTWSAKLIIPFNKSFVWDFGLVSLPWVVWMILSGSNSVNLTDGLDGLAILPVALTASGLAIIAYVVGNEVLSNYVMIPYVKGVGELSVVASAIAGTSLGFLWFNSYPAEVFMGDVGSLSLGALLAGIAVIIHAEILFAIMGAGFVMETLSVILQVLSYKLTGRRIFRMAPLHHHFELKGWPEPKVIVRFWIMCFICVVFSLLTLKIR